MRKLFARIHRLLAYRTTAPRRGDRSAYRLHTRPLFVYRPNRLPVFAWPATLLGILSPLVGIWVGSLAGADVGLAGGLAIGSVFSATMAFFTFIAIDVARHSETLLAIGAKSVTGHETCRTIEAATSLWRTASPAERSRVRSLPARCYALALEAARAEAHRDTDTSTFDAAAQEWHALLATTLDRRVRQMRTDLDDLVTALSSELHIARTQDRSPREVSRMVAQYHTLRSEDLSSEVRELAETARARAAVLLAGEVQRTEPHPGATRAAWDELDAVDATQSTTG